MEEVNLNNIKFNSFIKLKVDNIISDLKKEKYSISTVKKCEIIIDFINVKLLKEHFKKNIKSYDLIYVANEYINLDDKMFEIMKNINAKYNEINENNIRKTDIIFLLYQIDYILAHIKEIYGGILDEE